MYKYFFEHALCWVGGESRSFFWEDEDKASEDKYSFISARGMSLLTGWCTNFMINCTYTKLEGFINSVREYFPPPKMKPEENSLEKIEQFLRNFMH